MRRGNVFMYLVCSLYMCFCLFFFFFFKQKTAYEMRISDWSSDVCSSDLWICDSRCWLEGRPASDGTTFIGRSSGACGCGGFGGGDLPVCCGPVQIGRASCWERVGQDV